MERRYGSVPYTPYNWNSFEYFSDLVSQLDHASSPGIPYMTANPTIGGWLGWDGKNYDPVKLQLLWHDTQLVLQGKYNHYFRVFVKDEPHSLKKASTRRWRLIYAASLPVQMAWRMAFSHQNENLNARPYETPSGHGLVFCYGGWRRFKHHAKSLGLKISRDISAWDVNAPGWIIDAVMNLRLRWGGPPEWERVVKLLYDDAFSHAKLAFSNGMVVQQAFRGFQKSGLFSTIADNSLHMGILHLAACFYSNNSFTNWCATGDDVLQECIDPAYIQAVHSMGVTIKEYEPVLNFMGTSFQTEPKPLYLAKHIANYSCADKQRAEMLDAYGRYYSHSPFFKFWQVLSQVAKSPIRSQLYYQFWFDSPLAREINRGVNWQ